MALARSRGAGLWHFSGFCVTLTVCCVYKTLLFFLLLSTSAAQAQKRPLFHIPEEYYSFLPEDLGTLGALNQNEQELARRWADFLEDQYVASLTEADLQTMYADPQPPSPLGPWVHETYLDFIRRIGAYPRTYSDYDRKLLNRIFWGRPVLGWLNRVMCMHYSHPTPLSP